MSGLTHLDAGGAAKMVDVGGKPVTHRTAVARGRIAMSQEALDAIREGLVRKGDVLSAARIAGIMAAKRTGELIPLCHPLGIDAVGVEFVLDDAGIECTGTASVSARTGIEMEAMTAVCVALLTIYDMAKAIDRTMCIGEVRLIAKQGGKSGNWRAAGHESLEI